MLLQRQARTVVDGALDLTPMVDVVFQLLIFLMLTYRSSAEADVELPTALHGTGVEETEATTLTLAPNRGDGGGILVFGGMSTEPADRLDDDRAIVEAVEDGLRRGRRRVILQADGEVPHGEVLRVGSVVAEVEGIVLHLGVEDPQP